MKRLACLLLMSTLAGCASTQHELEYAEVRWEPTPTTSVTLERGGEQAKGVLFTDLLTYVRNEQSAKVPAERSFSANAKVQKLILPSGKAAATSSQLFAALSEDGWKVITHAIAFGDGNRQVEVWTLCREKK